LPGDLTVEVKVTVVADAVDPEATEAAETKA